jgi:ABC-type sugar transport system permease subunit
VTVFGKAPSVRRTVRTGSRKNLGRQIWTARWCYIFMLPSLALAALFTFYPVVSSWYISLLNWTGIESQGVYIGLANYREALDDTFFWNAFRRTFLFALVSVPTMVGLAFVVAIVLNDQVLRLSTVFRTIFFLPVVTTTAIVGVVMSLILNPFDGPVNIVLVSLGLIRAPIDFLGDPDIALWSVAGVFVWKWMGISMIYWLVAFQTVPRELHEAAEVDGASGWQRHRFITIPLILPFGAIITLIATVGALQVFPLVQSMTHGGPFFSTELVEVYIYRLAFAATGRPRLGYASAVAVFFGVTVLLFVIGQGWGLRKINALRSGSRRGG